MMINKLRAKPRAEELLCGRSPTTAPRMEKIKLAKGMENFIYKLTLSEVMSSPILALNSICFLSSNISGLTYDKNDKLHLARCCIM